jgi:hypothetical protein
MGLWLRVYPYEWYFDSEIIFISLEKVFHLLRHAFLYARAEHDAEMNGNVNCDDENKVLREKSFSFSSFS